MIFDFESPFFALWDKFAKLGKASQDAYNPGKWLILHALMKNWVAEGIASDVNVQQRSWNRKVFIIMLFSGCPTNLKVQL